MKAKPDFVIATSKNFTGFHSTNIKNPIHGYAPRPLEDCVQFIKESWPESTMTSDSMFDNFEGKRAYTERDIIYTNKIKTRLKQLEMNIVKKYMTNNNKVLDKD